MKKSLLNLLATTLMIGRVGDGRRKTVEKSGRNNQEQIHWRKAKKTSVLNPLAGLLIGTISAFGASWDDNFHTSYVDAVESGLGELESVRTIATLGDDLY